MGSYLFTLLNLYIFFVIYILKFSSTLIIVSPPIASFMMWAGVGVCGGCGVVWCGEEHDGGCDDDAMVIVCLSSNTIIQ